MCNWLDFQCYIREGMRHFSWDIPHETEDMLAYFAKDQRGPCDLGKVSDRDATCYNYDSKSGYAGEIKVDHIAVCNPPLNFSFMGKEHTLNSGTHRILFRNGDYVVAVEERENFNGTFAGEHIIVGAFTAQGRALVEKGGADFAFNLVKGMIHAASGMEPIIKREIIHMNNDPRFGGPEIQDRIEYTVTDARALLEEGCKLSPKGKGSPIYFLFD